jgi:serine/threonine protein phosphatase 1
MSRLIAIGDIHGCFMPFYELVVKTVDLKKSDRLILLGDYIDRGDQSREVVDFIMDLQNKGYDITPLSGNHEMMLADAYRDRSMLPLWYMNSGITTLISFGINDISEMPGKYLDFFNRLEYYKAVGDFLFVHAGFNNYADDPFEDKYYMVWECRPSYDNPLLQGKTIIHGHRRRFVGEVRQLISEKSKVIPLDTGCIYERELGYGFLSALEVNSMQLISVPNNQYAL